jgi:pimeloyl-ACP methyl ester carboxylesterase
MTALGFARFGLAGHHRSGRVVHRLALDHPDRVQCLAVLDRAVFQGGITGLRCRDGDDRTSAPRHGSVMRGVFLRVRASGFMSSVEA